MTGKLLSLGIADADDRSSDSDGEGSLSPELSPPANEIESGELIPLANEIESGDSSDSSDLEDDSSCSVILRSVYY